MAGFLLRGEHGGDLTLFEIDVRKENLICQVMGGGNVLAPVFGDHADDVQMRSALLCYSMSTTATVHPDEDGNVEVSILEQVRELLLNAQRHGCWHREQGEWGR